MILEASTERYRIVTVALGYILPTYLLSTSFENHITFSLFLHSFFTAFELLNVITFAANSHLCLYIWKTFSTFAA